jgi:hypothetical protein
MNVLFIISCINSKSKGLGGHYHSLKETLKNLKSIDKLSLVCVGNIFPKALINFEKECSINIYDFTRTEFKPFSILKKFKTELKIEEYNIIHSFDRNALYYGRILSYKYKIPSILTKCGGNNIGYLPYVENIIFYSKENYDFTNSKYNKHKKNIYLIPNRITEFESNIDNITKIKSTIKDVENKHVFLRISRIGKYYMQTNKNFIHLIKQLNSKGIKCVGLFVGTIEDERCLIELQNESDDSIYFFNSDEITKDAKSIIDVANVVIGTGRSIMEAMSKSKIVLSPIKLSNELVLVDENNFESLFYYNFSERSELLNFDTDQNIQKIINSLSNNAYKNQIIEFIEKAYSKNFDVKNLEKNYLNVYYNSKINNKFHVLDFIKHTLLQLKIYKQIK